MGAVSALVSVLNELPILLSLALVASIVGVLISMSSGNKEPPSLPENIPFLSNAYLYLTDVEGFMEHVNRELRTQKTDIIKFYMGPMKGYMVTGVKNIQKLFGSHEALDANWLIKILMDKHWEMSKEEIRKFSDDKSGRLETPQQGMEGVPEDKRIWLGHTRLYHDFLSKRKYADALADIYHSFFAKMLEEQPEGWSTINLFETVKHTMTESATKTLFGTRIMELSPGLVDAYWDFDQNGGKLLWGLPRWLDRRPYQARERLHHMTRKYIDSAWESYDWKEPESDWEPHWGSRLSREVAKWMRQKGFSDKAQAGHTLGTLFGVHGNSIPITTWALIELIKDQSLFRAAREEAMQTYVVDPTTGERRISAEKLVSMPLLQSIYVEILRLHVSYTVTREVVQPVSLDGYDIKRGALVQTNSEMAHRDEAVWGTDDHPASEFWAARNIKYIDTTGEAGNTTRQAQFCMKGRPSSFFPYGGGHVMCPGRHFAKQEILLTLAILITKFDMEFLDWTTMDGKKSDKPAHDDGRYAGIIAMPPDREMKIRWKKRW